MLSQQLGLRHSSVSTAAFTVAVAVAVAVAFAFARRVREARYKEHDSVEPASHTFVVPLTSPRLGRRLLPCQGCFTFIPLRSRNGPCTLTATSS